MRENLFGSFKEIGATSEDEAKTLKKEITVLAKLLHEKFPENHNLEEIIKRNPKTVNWDKMKGLKKK
jgi:hypothetical protein